jgi:hypothetical protein
MTLADHMPADTRSNLLRIAEAWLEVARSELVAERPADNTQSGLSKPE